MCGPSSFIVTWTKEPKSKSPGPAHEAGPGEGLSVEELEKACEAITRGTWPRFMHDASGHTWRKEAPGAVWERVQISDPLRAEKLAALNMS